MRKSIYKALFFLSVILVFCSGCQRYGWVRVQYPTAPPLELSKDIHAIAVINRSLPPNGTKESGWDKVVKGTLVGNDKLASDDALKGVFDRMNGVNGRTIVIPSQTRYVGTGTRQTPEIMDWKLVEKICKENGADVLLVLEMFNSKTDLILATVNQNIGTLQTALKGQVPNPVPPNQFKVNVETFWRMYDPVSKTIIDQYQTSNYMTVNANGSAIPVAPPDALQNMAYVAGQEYANRFMPGQVSVRRTLYRRGNGRDDNQQFLMAFRRSEVADWNGAVDVWTQLANTSSRGKNKGRACLNIAVANEVLGNYDTALSWAQKAYVDYRNKIASDYQNYLKYRINNQY